MPDARKILVIEDSALNRSVLEQALGERGYSVETAEDGEQGLARLKEKSPDLILMDVVMPNMSGLEVCRHLRNAARSQSIPIIIMTSKNTPQDQLQAFEVGADEFIDKPINMDELFEMIERLLPRDAAA